MVKSGMEQTARDRNVSRSEGLRSRYHFPHYPILCQVTGETLGGGGVKVDVRVQLVFRDVLACLHEVTHNPPSLLWGSWNPFHLKRLSEYVWFVYLQCPVGVTYSVFCLSVLFCRDNNLQDASNTKVMTNFNNPSRYTHPILHVSTVAD